MAVAAALPRSAGNSPKVAIKVVPASCFAYKAASLVDSHCLTEACCRAIASDKLDFSMVCVRALVAANFKA